jgi:hypothetical protein
MAIKGSVAGDLGRLAQRLPVFFDGEARRARRVLRDEIQDRTPVGRRVDPDTGRDLGPSGRLRRSVRVMPVRRIGRERWVTGAESNEDHASHVEFGTRRHVIQGNLHLRYWSNGQLHFHQRVNHPGAPGVFMFLRGAQAAEKIWAQNADRQLQVFIDADR